MVINTLEDVALLFGQDDGDSLFGCDDADMESLFGGSDDLNASASPVSSAPCPLPLPASLPPLALPATPPAAASTQQGSRDVSILPEPQHSTTEGGLPLPDPAADPAPGLDQEEGRELWDGLEQQLLQELDWGWVVPGGGEEHQQAHTDRLGQDTPSQETIDTPHSAAGRVSEPASQLGRDDQHAVDADTSNDDDDVILVGHTQVGPPTQSQPPPVIPHAHYLELRPRCPEHPPPPHIHLYNRNIEELLPYVQLDHRLSFLSLYRMLDISKEAGKCVVKECRYHLRNPAHAILPSGSSDPAALRILKVTLMISSQAFLVQEGMGERWFGPRAEYSPKSRYAWPNDSTVLVLIFTQLLYIITRNDSISARQRLVKARQNRHKPARSAAVPRTPSAPVLPRTHWPQLAHNSPWCLRERLAAEQERQTRELSEPASVVSFASTTSSAVFSPLSPGSTVVSGGSTTPTSPGTLLAAPAAQIMTKSADRPDKERQPSATAASHYESQEHTSLVRAPADAAIRYLVNVTQGTQGTQRRVVPQLALGHTGAIRVAGYSFLVSWCASLGYRVASISIVTLLGLERISDNQSWDEAVCQVHDEMLMDDEVRVLVCLE